MENLLVVISIFWGGVQTAQDHLKKKKKKCVSIEGKNVLH